MKRAKQKRGSLPVAPLQALCFRCGIVSINKPRMFCPKCGSFLGSKIGMIGGPGTFETLRPPRGESLINALARDVQSHGFLTATYRKRYVAARHKRSGKTIFIKIVERQRRSRSWLSGIYFRYDSFKRMIESLDGIWSFTRRTAVSNLNVRVLTVFDWHAKNDEPARQSALERSAAGLGYKHVLNVLRWLRNSWTQHPTHHIYADAVQHDYSWFKREFAESASQRATRREAYRAKLDLECKQVLSKSGSVREILRTTHPDRIFIISR